MRKAIFLDKDGTLVPNVPYNVDSARIELNPGVGETLRRLGDAGYIFVVVSNQSGIARKLFTEAELERAFERLKELLDKNGVTLAGLYWCPHHPDHDGPCDCRKPAPGLLKQAIVKLGIDPAQSWMVGDELRDVEAGARAGCRTILLTGDDAAEQPADQDYAPDATVRSFTDIYDVVIGGET